MSVKSQSCLSQNWVVEVFSGIPVISVQALSLCKAQKDHSKRMIVAGLIQPAPLHKNPEERMDFQGRFTAKPPCFRCRKGSCSRPAAHISAQPKWKVHCQNVSVKPQMRAMDIRSRFLSFFSVMEPPLSSTDPISVCQEQWDLCVCLI